MNELYFYDFIDPEEYKLEPENTIKKEVKKHTLKKPTETPKKILVSESEEEKEDEEEKNFLESSDVEDNSKDVDKEENPKEESSDEEEKEEEKPVKKPIKFKSITQTEDEESETDSLDGFIVNSSDEEVTAPLNQESEDEHSDEEKEEEIKPRIIHEVETIEDFEEDEEDSSSKRKKEEDDVFESSPDLIESSPKGKKHKRRKIDEEKEKEAERRRGFIIDDEDEYINRQREKEKREKEKREKELLKYSKLAVNISKKEKEKEVFFSKEIGDVIKPHQLEGIRFLWDHIVAPEKENEKGCILAHSMGLGKTFQVVVFSQLCIEHQKAKKVLIICPKSVIDNWNNEYKNWCKRGNLEKPKTFPLNDNTRSIDTKLQMVENWSKNGGVLLLSFNLLTSFCFPRKSTKSETQKKSEKCKKLVLEADMVFVDEGHKVKNKKSALYKAITTLKTKSRVILTGTPLQNNLKEYWAMSNFVRPDFWDEKDFNSFYIRPINAGQAADATPGEIKLMKRRSFLLSEEMKKFIHRKDQSVLRAELPPKHEYVIYVPLNDFQKKLYQKFLDFTGKSANILYYASILGKVCAHPDLIRDFIKEGKDDADIKEIMSGVKDEDAESGVKDEEDKEEDEEDLAGSSSMGTNIVKIVKTDWASDVMRDDYIENDLDKSPKISIMLQIIELCLKKKEKLLIFSQFTKTLDLFEKMIAKNKKMRNLIKKEDYYRLDGQTPSNQRDSMIRDFNGDTTKKKIFFISTKAGGLGINLFSASRIVLFDVCWNPTDDSQSIFRAYRYGQKKPVFIYRLVSAATVEENIWKRCISKTWLFQRVVDEKTPQRVLNREDFDLFEFEKNQEKLSDFKVDFDVFKIDDLLTIVVNDKKKLFNRILEHESLFIHDDNEIITEEEQIVAKGEKENHQRFGTQNLIVKDKSALERLKELIPSTSLGHPTVYNIPPVPPRNYFFQQNTSEQRKVTKKPTENILQKIQSKVQNGGIFDRFNELSKKSVSNENEVIEIDD